MTPYRTRAIERDPPRRKTLGDQLRRLDYLFTERPAWWLIPAGIWLAFWWTWGMFQP